MLEKMSEMIAEQLNCDAETITADTSFTLQLFPWEILTPSYTWMT